MIVITERDFECNRPGYASNFTAIGVIPGTAKFSPEPLYSNAEEKPCNTPT